MRARWCPRRRVCARAPWRGSAPPGGPRQLAEVASHLVKIHLDRERPLWECWAIEGLEHGHVAVLTKVHHAAIDGVSGNEITVAMLQLNPDDEAPPPAEEWQPD